MKLFFKLIVLFLIGMPILQNACAEEMGRADTSIANMPANMFNLKYVQAKDVVEPIEKILSPKGRLEIFDLPGQESGSIFVQDIPERLEIISQLLKNLDKSSLPATKVTVNYSDASIVDVLRSLSEDTHINIIAGKDITGSVTVHLVDVPLEKALDEILLSNGYTYLQEDNILRVVPINSVPLPEAKPLATKVFVLKYCNAEDMKTILEKFITKEGVIQIFTKTSTSNSKIRPNTIIVKDKAEVVENIGNVIKSLDQESPQFLIEAKFLSVSLDDTDNKGIDWIINAALSGSSAPTTFPLPSKQLNAGIIPGGAPADIPGTFPAASSFPFASKEDFTFGAMNFTQTKAVLKMLESNTKVKIISSPRVSALDGEEAFINIGTNFPIPLYEHSQQTGVQYISGYQEVKIGIILKVTPYLSGDNRIMLNLHPEVSEITSYVGPNNERPVTSTKEVSTSVSVINGGTIIIGGLIKDTDTVVETHVPVLGKIPFFGAPFHYKSKVKSRNELLIFLTPHVITKETENEAPRAKAMEANQ